jgi:hypothetical protein
MMMADANPRPQLVKHCCYRASTVDQCSNAAWGLSRRSRPLLESLGDAVSPPIRTVIERSRPSAEPLHPVFDVSRDSQPKPTG